MTLRIVFDLDFDGGAWPGPLAHGRVASAGQAWLGPAGLLDQLELRLGLGGPRPSHAQRIAAILPSVRSTDGFWSRSAETDAIETAAALLRWRDLLREGGWHGEPVTSRLAQLAAVTASAPDGFSDRLLEVIATLPRRRPDISTVELFEEPEQLPWAWRQVLRGLAARGTEVRLRPLQLRPATGDLQGARNGDFRPAFDGSLRLLRPYGALEAAEEVAAWLAALPSLESTVIVGADPVLDAALHRHGLPTTGAPGTRHRNVLLQILPLVLALGWRPADPLRALELLTLPLGPVPADIARRLVTALGEWPALDSDAWRRALRAGLARIGDETDRRQVADRLEAIFRPVAGYAEPYPASEAIRRTELVRAWLDATVEAELAAARAGLFTTVDGAPWSAAVHQCDVLVALLESAGHDELSAAQLQRFLELAGGETDPLHPFPAQAGLAAVRRPGAVCGEAQRIVWWGFTLDSVPGIPTLPLTVSERRALEDAGAHLPVAAREAQRLALRWRRPLDCARSALLLVCPHHADNGDEQYPHPLWDEITARLEPGRIASALEVPAQDSPETTSTIPVRVRRSLRPLPTPTSEWHIPPGSIPRRGVESPSSAATLIGCSFKWTAQYRARLYPGRARRLSDESRLLGSVVHELLAQLLTRQPSDPDDAARLAGELFEAEAPRLAAPLFLPGADATRATARRALVESARVLVDHLRSSGRRVVAVETPYVREALETRLEGRPDLVVGPSPAIIDLKWGGTRFHRESLEAGTACQLAAYSHLVTPDGDPRLAPTAYFILRDRRLLAIDRAAFPQAVIVQGPPPEDTWEAFQRAHQRAWQALEAGLLQAPFHLAEEGQDTVTEGTLVLRPPCHFCEMEGLCGAAFLVPGPESRVPGPESRVPGGEGSLVPGPESRGQEPESSGVNSHEA